MSESQKYLDVTLPYLVGNGCDIGSGGEPVMQNCISIDLPEPEYICYNSHLTTGQVNLRAHAHDLPFKDGTLDWVYSSHLLEDFSLQDWPKIVGEWVRVLKPGGTLLILVPEATKWREALGRGQPPNTAHKHEANPGELSGLAPFVGITVVREEPIGDYSIIFVATKYN